MPFGVARDWQNSPIWGTERVEFVIFLIALCTCALSMTFANLAPLVSLDRQLGIDSLQVLVTAFIVQLILG